MASSAPQLRFSTLVTKTAILLLDWLGLLLRRQCVQLQTWLFIPFNILNVFLQVSNWWSSCLVSHLLDNSSHFSWAIVCSSAPQLRYSTLVTKTERYCCWTDWVFFWEDHAFSYKLGCLIPSNLSLMFFLQVSIWRSCFLPGRFASCSQIAAFFGGPSLCVALLHNWDVLPWLLRQRYCCWTVCVFFWEDHAFSYKLGCLIPSTLAFFFAS